MDNLAPEAPTPYSPEEGDRAMTRRYDTLEDIARETRARATRIETRLAKVCKVMGIDIDTTKPKIEDGVLVIPSIHSSLKEILDAIPPSKNVGTSLNVYLGGDLVATIVRPPGT